MGFTNRRSETNGAGATAPRVKLRVAESGPGDVGRAVARIDPDHLKALGISIGDTVLVTQADDSGRSAVCKAMPTFADARGQSLVQLDGLARENVGAAVGVDVHVSPAACQEAESVTIEPVTMAVRDKDMAYIGSLLDGLPCQTGDRLRATLFGSRSADFRVTTTTPSGPVVITPTTTLRVPKPSRNGAGNGSSNGAKPQQARISYEDVGGLKPQLRRIREMIELPLRCPEAFERLGIDPPRGVLLHGTPGTGKTLIARAIAHEAQAKFFVISGPEIVHKHYGESERRLREVWDQAAKSAPAIIFIDEIDSIAPSRERTEGEVEKRIVAQLLALMDGLKGHAGIVVLAATNLPNNVDPALRRPGRFDREIEVPVPDREGRRQILAVHTRGMPLADDVDLDHVARVTHGCVGADLRHLCREAAMAALRTVVDDLGGGRDIPYEKLRSIDVKMQHFNDGLGEIQPSAIREVFVETPDVSWDDIGGLHDIKRRLIEAVQWPIEHANTFRQAGLRPPKGILLAGPPGVGKTMLAKAAAAQTEANFISVKGPEVLNKFVGESERGLREVFKKARQASPCIVFFDEIDSIAPARGRGEDPVAERLLAQFLAELDGVEELNGVLILGATNRVDRLDPAMLRPGRFDEVIELGRPDAESRVEIARVHLQGKPVEQSVSPSSIAEQMENASGAEIAGVIRRAAMFAVRRAIATDSAVSVTNADITEAIAEDRNDLTPISKS